jgi:hypothetical protein
MKEKIDRLLSKKPLLMAKDIAKAIGTPKKEVNAYLHSNLENYEQDAEFKWRLIDTEKATLTLPTGWVTGEALEVILQEAGELLNGPCRKVEIVFSSGCNTMIDCTARLLALMNQLAQQGKSVTVDFTNCGPTRFYLNRAGFFDLLNKSVSVLPGRPSVSAAKQHQGKSDTLVEFGRVDPNAENQDLITQLTNKFVQQSSTDFEVAAYTVFAELIGNVKEHSKSPLEGFSGLQIYGGHRKHIQTVVSDSGLGIASTLRPALKEHYPDLYNLFGKVSLESDIGLVTEAMSKGKISRFGSDSGRGLGFKSSREQAMKFNARFSVRQERFCLKFEYRDGELIDVKPQSGLSNLKGTHICFDFYLD